MEKFKIGDFVIKNSETWVVNEFDEWGRGVGIGVIVKSSINLKNDEVDVLWPTGRCFEYENQLLLSAIAPLDDELPLL